jgi:hypothetical protein
MLALSAASLDVLPGVVLGERGRSLLFTTSLQDWRRPAIRFATPSERTRPMAALPNIVLVHGAWADGSCWSDVIERPSSNVVMGTPAWKALPSWYLVAENDEVIPPDAERQFAQRMGADTIEVASGHCAMVSHPEDMYERIVTAANAVAG